MKKSDLYEDELAALMKALKDGKSVLTVKGVDNIENVRRRMIDRVGKDGGWRFYARKTEKMDESRIYIFSPACDDPEPARNWNGPHKLSSKESRKIKEAEQIRQWKRRMQTGRPVPFSTERLKNGKKNSWTPASGIK